MSHATVMVAGLDYEAQLEPFDENKEVAPYRVNIEAKEVGRLLSYLRRGLLAASDKYTSTIIDKWFRIAYERRLQAYQEADRDDSQFYWWENELFSKEANDPIIVKLLNGLHDQLLDDKKGGAFGGGIQRQKVGVVKGWFIEPFLDEFLAGNPELKEVAAVTLTSLVKESDSWDSSSWILDAEAHEAFAKEFLEEDGQTFKLGIDWEKADTHQALYRMSTYNPQSKWDWYQVGGRWQGFFKAKPGTLPVAHAVEGEGVLPAVGDSSWVTKPGVAEQDAVCDRILKRDLDVEGMKQRTYDEALLGYEEAKTSPWRKDDFLERFPTPEAYAAHKAETALVPFAVLHEGKWAERGELGWWGAVHNEKEERTWEQEFWGWFNSLPDDTVLTLVDYHI